MVRTFNSSPFSDLRRAGFRLLAQHVWNAYQKEKCDVSMNFVSKEEIVALNKSWFKKLAPTDVISFNLGESPDKKILGDVYICPEIAQENAEKYHCTLEEELARLVIHGMLHLLGFEDATLAQKAEMRTLEDSFLQWFGAIGK